MATVTWGRDGNSNVKETKWRYLKFVFFSSCGMPFGKKNYLIKFETRCYIRTIFAFIKYIFLSDGQVVSGTDGSVNGASSGLTWMQRRVLLVSYSRANKCALFAKRSHGPTVQLWSCDHEHKRQQGFLILCIKLYACKYFQINAYN